MSPPPDPRPASVEGVAAIVPPQPPSPSGKGARAAVARRAITFAILIAAGVGAAAWRYHITRPAYRLARGEDAIAERDWKTAAEYADRLSKSGQTDVAHLLLAEMYYARQEHDQVIAECNQISDAGTIRVRAVVLTGKSLLQLGEMQEADRAFRFAIQQDEDCVDAHRGCAAIAYEMGQFSRAEEHLRQVMRLDPSDSRPHRMLAEIMRSTGKTSAAIAAYQEALRIGNGLSSTARDEVQRELCELLAIAYRFSELLALVDAADPADQERTPLIGYRIEALRGLHRQAEAKALADRALENSPNATVYRLRGQLHLEDGNGQAALSLLEKAAAAAPHDYHTQFLLGQAYAACGRSADADRANARANELRQNVEQTYDLLHEAMARPWDAEVRLRLAELAEQSGDNNSAAQWRRAAAQCRARKP